MNRQASMEILQQQDLLRDIASFNHAFIQDKLKRELDDNEALLYKLQPQSPYFKPYKQLSFDFAIKEQRLALLNEEELQLLAQYLGASLLAPSIAQILWHEDIDKLKHSLGIEIYDFSVNFARYFFNQEDILKYQQDDLSRLSYEILPCGMGMLRQISTLFANDELAEHFIERLNQICDEFKPIDNIAASKLYMLAIKILKMLDNKWKNYSL